MNWVEEVNQKVKQKKHTLFCKKSEYLQDLIELFQGRDHRVMALWAFDFAAESIAELEKKHPNEKRPREALEAARSWAAGTIKMRSAQRKILDCHAAAKEIGCSEDIAACHAIGQACAVVHTAGHAIGYPIYDLTSIRYRFDRLEMEGWVEEMEQRKQRYKNKLLFWEAHISDYRGTWATFMTRRS